MELFYLLYVSRARIDPLEADAVIGAIMELSKERNAADRLTGALLYTGRYFAQAFEGEEAAIAALIDSIASDRRHENLLIVDRRPVEVRQFPDYRLAYSGPSHFVERHITRLFDAKPGAESDRAAHLLTRLILEFATGE